MPITPEEMLAALPRIGLEHRRMRLPDYRDTEEADWSEFVRCVTSLAAGVDAGNLQHYLEAGLPHPGGTVAAASTLTIYHAWRYAECVLARAPLRRRSRKPYGR